MFVFNCHVDHSQFMKYADKEKFIPKRQSRKRKAEDSEQSMPGTSTTISNTDDLYNPVFCKSCNTCIALFDADEVYHFFNVLASHS